MSISLALALLLVQPAPKSPSLAVGDSLLAACTAAADALPQAKRGEQVLRLHLQRSPNDAEAMVSLA